MEEEERRRWRWRRTQQLKYSGEPNQKKKKKNKKQKNFLQRIEKSDANMGRPIGEEKKNYTQAER